MQLWVLHIIVCQKRMADTSNCISVHVEEDLIQFVNCSGKYAIYLQKWSLCENVLIEKKSRKLKVRKCRGLRRSHVGVEYVADKVVPDPGLDRGSKCRVKFHEKILKTIHFVLTASSQHSSSLLLCCELGQDRTAFGMKRQRSRWKCRICFSSLLFSSDEE